MSRLKNIRAMLIGSMVTASAVAARSQQPAVATNPGPASPAPAVVQPSTPADMPPSPPRVNCDNGNLTISAENSTVAAVLYAIRGCTGAQIDVPEGAGAERLFAKLGPGPMRSVLTDFLAMTDYNYVFGASASDPQRIETVLLSARNGQDAPAKAVVPEGRTMSVNRKAWIEARQNYLQSFSPHEEDGSDSANDATQEAGPKVAAASANVPPVSAAEPDKAHATAQNTQPATDNNPAEVETASAALVPKSEDSRSSPDATGTEKMISDMRQLFEQRKQMVQQTQNPSK